jgi:hypothetical protein
MDQLNKYIQPPFVYDLVTMSIYDKNIPILKLTVTEKPREIADFIVDVLNEKWQREVNNQQIGEELKENGNEEDAAY